MTALTLAAFNELPEIFEYLLNLPGIDKRDLEKAKSQLKPGILEIMEKHQ